MPISTKQFLIAAIATTVIVFSSIASAADWELIDDLPDAKIYLDRSSVDWDNFKNRLGDKRQVKILFSYKTAQRNLKGVTFFSMSFLDVLSCAEKTKTTLSSVQFEGKIGAGKVVNSHKMGVLLPQTINPGTVDELILGEANCNLFSGKWKAQRPYGTL